MRDDLGIDDARR